MKMVAFKSSAESVTALLGRHIDVVASTVTNVIPHVNAGTLRVIAVSAPQRLSGSLASVPTWKEQGVNAVFESWLGVIAPGGLASAQVAFWEQVLERSTRSDAWRTHAQSNFWDVSYIDSRQYRSYLDAQNVALSGILGQLGMAKQ
jgi:putative tricarboxylic transport membrane protein